VITRNKELTFVYNGWDGYNASLIKAVAPLTNEQLAYRIGEDWRSVGEVAFHISKGRIDWLQRIDPRFLELAPQSVAREADKTPFTSDELVDWFQKTWSLVNEMLSQWTVDDLSVTYNQPYQGKVFAVSRQWTIWRIMAHDIHHGGQLTEMLGMQGIVPVELGWLGGHITEPPLAR